MLVFRHATIPGAGHLSCRGFYRRRAAGTVALSAGAVAAHPNFPQIAHAPFHRFVDRSFLILALAGLWPLLRALGTTSFREAGLVPPYGQSRKFFGGLLLGFCSLAVVAVRRRRVRRARAAQGITAHKIIGTICRRHRHGGGRGHAGGNFVSRRHFRRIAARALLAVRTGHQQRDLRARAFSSARGNHRRGRAGTPASFCCRTF